MSVLCWCQKSSRRTLHPNDDLIVPRLILRAPLRQQQSSASVWKTARRYHVLVQVQSCPKPAESHVHASLSPCGLHSAPITLRVFHHSLSHRSLPSFSRALVVSVPLLISYIGDGALLRLDLFRLQLALPIEI